MKSLTKLYKECAQLPLTDDWKELIPTSVFVALTKCAAVRKNEIAAMSKAFRESFAKKDELMAALREVFESGGTSIDLGEEYDLEKIKKLCVVLNNNKLIGLLARFNPRLSFHEGFFSILTGTVDVITRDNDVINLWRLSRAKSQTETDELSVLVYILLAYIAYPDEWDLIFKKIPVMVNSGKEESWHLERKELTEDPRVTLKKILGSLLKTQRDKGKDCACCIHAPYCKVLTEDVQREAEEAVDANM